MFDGFLTFAGDEIINVVRTNAYLANGYIPPGVEMNACEDCGVLDEVLNDGKPYASPLIDLPPWFDSSNADTYDFAGVIPLEITGMSGSTREATPIEYAGDGGTVSQVRFGSRTIAVTALLVGRTGCAVEAGLTWLTTVLNGSSCRSRDGVICLGDELCALTCCPGSLDEVPVPNQYVTTDISTIAQGWSTVSGTWNASSGTFNPIEVIAGTLTNQIVNPSFEVDTSLWRVTAGALQRVDTIWPNRIGGWSGLLTAGGILVETVNVDALTGAGLTVTLGAQGSATASNPTAEAVVVDDPSINGWKVTLGASGSQVAGVGSTMVFGPGTTYPVTSGKIVDWTLNLGTTSRAIAAHSELVFLNAADAVISTFVGATTEINSSSYGVTKASVVAPTNPTPVVTATNQSRNPNIEGGTTGGWNSSDDATWAISASTTTPISGTRSVLSTRQAVNPSPTVASAYLTADAVTPFAVTPGVPVTVAFDVKVEQGARQISGFCNFPGFGQSTTVTIPAGAAGSVVRFVMTGTPPAGATVMYPNISVATTGGNALNGERVWLDNLYVGGDSTGVYFDGSTPAAAPYTYRWGGAPNASTSEKLSSALKVRVDVKVNRVTGEGGGPPLAGTQVLIDAAALYLGAKVAGRGYFDGDTRDTVNVDYTWDGTPGLSTSTAVAAGQQPELDAPAQDCAEEAVFSWNVCAISGGVTVVPAAKDAETGGFLAYGDPVEVHGCAPVPFTADPGWGAWVPVLLVDTSPGANPFTVDPQMRQSRYQTQEECLEAITRSYLDVTTISGPTVVEKVPFICGEYALKVEWTWHVGNPGSYGPQIEIVNELSSLNGVAEDVAPNVVTGSEGLIPMDDTPVWAVGPILPGAIQCATDPGCPGFVPPPAVPVLDDTCWEHPVNFRRSWVQIPASYAPGNENGTLVVTLHNDNKPKKGLRVRVFPDPLGFGLDGVPRKSEPAAVCAEFNVTYLPASSEFTIDGVRRQVTMRCPGENEIVAGASTRGQAGAAFEFPSLVCNMGYVVAIDVPDKYQSSASTPNGPVYTVGQTEGDLTVDLALRTGTF